MSGKACERLKGSGFDVLLSHSSPKGIGVASDAWGSGRLREVVESCQPYYLFFAHHDDPISPASIGRTKCYWLSDVNFSKGDRGINSPVASGCMGILSWIDEDNHEFGIVEERWMEKVTFANWWRD